jgi:hypothetical protein
LAVLLTMSSGALLEPQAPVHNNILHTVTKQIPSKQFTGKYIPLKRLHPFGARVKVLTHLPSERSLTARTSGDNRPDSDYNANAITILDSTVKSSFTGRYLGISNHENVVLVYKEATDTETHRVARVHHCQVDAYGFSTSPSDQLTPNEQMLRALHNQVFDTTAPTQWQSELEPCALDTVKSPFDPQDCQIVTITLPPKVKLSVSMSKQTKTIYSQFLPKYLKITRPTTKSH